MVKITHKQLVYEAAKWLKKHDQNIVVPNCSTVIVEQKTTADEIPDVIGFNSWASIKIEVKTSYPDFRKDLLKKFKDDPMDGMGEFRYYFCPDGIIPVRELPKNWGLLYYDNKRVTIIKKAEWQNANLKGERSILLSFFNR